MALKIRIVLLFLQLIILSVTALIYIGQSALRVGSSDGDVMDVPIREGHVTQSIPLITIAALCMAISGILLSIYLIPTVAGEQLTLLQFWLIDTPLLSPFSTPPFLLFLGSLAGLYWLFKKQRESMGWLASVTALFAIGTFGAAGAILPHYTWIPLAATSAFALGMSLFLAGLVRLAQGFNPL